MPTSNFSLLLVSMPSALIKFEDITDASNPPSSNSLSSNSHSCSAEIEQEKVCVGTHPRPEVGKQLVNFCAVSLRHHCHRLHPRLHPSPHPPRPPLCMLQVCTRMRVCPWANSVCIHIRVCVRTSAQKLSPSLSPPLLSALFASSWRLAEASPDSARFASASSCIDFGFAGPPPPAPFCGSGTNTKRREMVSHDM